MSTLLMLDADMDLDLDVDNGVIVMVTPTWSPSLQFFKLDFCQATSRPIFIESIKNLGTMGDRKEPCKTLGEHG